MLNFSLSFIPFIVLTAVNFVVSWLWYSPLLFAKPWMKALGTESKHTMSETEKKQMPFLFASGLLSSALMVYVMMVLVQSLNASSFLQGAVIGLVVWAGYALTHSLNTLWEGRKAVVLVINNGLFLLTYMVFGGVLAIWK